VIEASTFIGLWAGCGRLNAKPLPRRTGLVRFHAPWRHAARKTLFCRVDISRQAPWCSANEARGVIDDAGDPARRGKPREFTPYASGENGTCKKGCW